MQRKYTKIRDWFGCTLLVLTQAVALQNVHAQSINDCNELLFSTSEDFITQGPVPIDGNPIISDGDLLMRGFPNGGGEICLRNRDLLQKFQVEADLGLDALWRSNESEPTLAFSTELDDPNGQFTAGDLLWLEGLIIPNTALLAAFPEVRPNLNLGLDAVHIVGQEELIREFLEEIAGISREEWSQNRELLPELLENFDIDIWFSTEGTSPTAEAPGFLDGDLLSARRGVIVRSNANLLPSLPAGLPNRGADFGLDAYTAADNPQDDESEERDLFSTEIVGGSAPPFSDGDLLSTGPNIVLKSLSLIESFEPVSYDFGLDALHLGQIEPPDQRACTGSRITLVSNRVVDADHDRITGFGIDMNGMANQPYGGWIRIQGTVPGGAGVSIPDCEYSVEVDVGAGFNAIVVQDNLPPTQLWRRPIAGSCFITPFNDIYNSDSNGWFALTDYWRFAECGGGPVSGPSLIYWNSAPFNNITVSFRVVVRETGAPATAISSPPVRVRIDNDRIEVPSDLDFTLFDSQGMRIANQCSVDSTIGSLQVQGRISDEHFSRYTLSWAGGDQRTDVAVTQPTPLWRTYQRMGLELDEMGTQPTGTDVLLDTIDLSAEHMMATGNPLRVDCGYNIRLRACERTIDGSFRANRNLFRTDERCSVALNRPFCVNSPS